MTKTITPHESARKTLVIEPDADVQSKPLDLLRDNEPLFKSAYERKRRVKDQSAGAYQRELVGFAVRAGWTDQETCNLVIKWRQTHGESFKPDPRYYAAIIAQARAAEERKEVLSGGVSADLSREERLEQLSTLLGVSTKGANITGVQRFHTDPRSYVVRLGNGSYLEFKNGDDLFSQSKLRGALIDYANVIMPEFKSAEWRRVQEHIAACIEDVESSDEATHLGSCRAWLRTYIRKCLRADMHEDGQKRAALEGMPAVLNGGVWFALGGFKRSIMIESSTQPPSSSVLAVRLKQIGCEYAPQVALRPSGDSNTSRSLWRVPDGFMDDEPV
jgi:hypothetical protein